MANPLINSGDAVLVVYAQYGSSGVSLRCVPQNQENCKGQIGRLARS